MGERSSNRTAVRKPEGKRSAGRHRFRWENNIKMDLKRIQCQNINWIHLAQDGEQVQAFMNMIMNFRFP
jgi:hypothetical protein